MRRRGLLITGIVLGVLVLLVAVWAFVMFGPPRYSEVVSQPEFCARCHEMDPQYTRFITGTHGELESCNDCHLPNRTFAGHWFWDSVVGARDLILHTVGAIPEQDEMEATNQSRGWIQENCSDCHVDDVDEHHGEEEEFCWDCHDDVSHEAEAGAQHEPAPVPIPIREMMDPIYYARVH